MAELREQLNITVPNEVGRLAAMTDSLKAAGVNILAACAWVEGDTGHMMLITDDNAKVRSTVAELGGKCQASEVVTLATENKVGALDTPAKKLADAGISVLFCYGTTSGDKAAVVMNTDDNTRAVTLL